MQRLDSKANRFLFAFALCVAAFALLGTQAVAALDYGHVRAHTRAFHYRGIDDSTSEESIADVTAEEPEDIAPTVGVAEVSATPAVSEDDPPEIGGNAGQRWLPFSHRSKDTFKTGPRSGYLAFGPPNPLRFSDDLAGSVRPAAPALPEFTMLPSSYDPYLIEEPLPEDAKNDPSLLSEIVVDLEPHEVVSGIIDTKPKEKVEKVVQLDPEDNQSSVLRPADVLIYFEGEGPRNEVKTIVPFSPVAPTTETIKSSAKLKTE